MTLPLKLLEFELLCSEVDLVRLGTVNDSGVRGRAGSCVLRIVMGVAKVVGRVKGR